MRLLLLRRSEWLNMIFQAPTRAAANSRLDSTALVRNFVEPSKKGLSRSFGKPATP